jgi:hypothetical protein
VIVRNPQVRDHFLVLDRHESFGDYARAYGDAIAEHYENNGVVVVPHMPIAFDREFFRDLEIPPEWKKIGTANGIDRPVFVRRGQMLVFADDHPLVQRFGQSAVAVYAQEQIASFNAQLRHGLSLLFPRYFSMREGNITWRLTETVAEGLHFDVFQRGAPLTPVHKSLHRVKLFINIDDEPRKWRTSHDMPEALKAGRGLLPEELPDDVNVVCDVIDKFGLMKSLPGHAIAYPTMSAVFANGETVAHEVTYGRRVVGVELICQAEDMHAPQKLSHRCIGGWLRDAGYRVSQDATAIALKYAHMKGSYALLQAARKAAAPSS